MNWQSLIWALRAQGMSLTEIARRCGAPVSTVSELAQGRSKQPRGSLALALVALQPSVPPDEEHRHAA